MRTLTATAGALAFLAISGTRAAQPQEKPPAFEVASVKRSAPIDSGAVMIMMGRLQGDRWITQGTTLLMLIRSAYSPRFQMEGQILGGPDWIRSDRFDVNAKTDGTPTIERARVMLQQLLAERFKLAVHTDTRELPVFALVPARSDGSFGRNLKPIETDCDAFRAAQKPGGAPPPPPPAFSPDSPPPACSTFIMMSGLTMRLRSGGTTMAQLASTLSQNTGRPVVDRTGLTGSFSLDLEFARDPGAPGPLGVGPVPPTGQAVDPNLASVFSAVQEQLGLKLESRREEVEVLVIDGAEPPTEN